MDPAQVYFSEVLGQLLKRRRQEREITQEDLARKIGVTASAWSRVESGKTAITVQSLRLAAEVLGTSASALLASAEKTAAEIEAKPEFRVREGFPKAAASRSASGDVGWFLGAAAVGALVAALAASRDDDEDNEDGGY